MRFLKLFLVVGTLCVLSLGCSSSSPTAPEQNDPINTSGVEITGDQSLVVGQEGVWVLRRGCNGGSISWSATGGRSGTGSSFSTRWPVSGMKQVTATCSSGGSDSVSVEVIEAEVGVDITTPDSCGGERPVGAFPSVQIGVSYCTDTDGSYFTVSFSGDEGGGGGGSSPTLSEGCGVVTLSANGPSSPMTTTRLQVNLQTDLRVIDSDEIACEISWTE